MISYRTSNLFDSIKKQMNPFKPGDVFTAKEKFRFRDRFVIEPGINYIFSHMKDDKIVMQEQAEWRSWGEISPQEVMKYFNKVGEANLFGFKVGDKVDIPSGSVVNPRINGLYIIRIGLAGGEPFSARGYFNRGKESETPDYGYDLKDIKK
jgi:hypothetical protein